MSVDVQNGHLKDATSVDPESPVTPGHETAKTPSSPYSAQDLTTKFLEFLATASNETLGLCFLGLGACTYLILGRVGLVLIGAVGGIVLHASWEHHSENGASKEKKERESVRRREVGLDVVTRVLDWRETTRVSTERAGYDAEHVDVLLSAKKTLDFSGFAPETSAALEKLTSSIIQDYVKWWYSPILPSDLSFPSASRQTLTAFIISISAHLSRKRPADTFLDFLTNSSSIVIVFLSELSNALSASSVESSAEIVDEYLTENPECNLANIMDETNQRKKLVTVAEDILESFLDSKTYNCEAARVFLREILANIVLDMTIASCSKPEWINGWIVYLLEEGEPELLNVIDAGMVRDTTGSVGRLSLDSKTSFDISHREEQNENRKHQKRLSKAEDAMEEAMLEAKRLSALIAEEETKRRSMQFSSGDGTEIYSPDLSSSLPKPKAKKRISSPSRSAINGETLEESISPSSWSRPGSTSNTGPPTPATSTTNFTSFDQLVPASKPTALLSTPPSPVPKLEPPEASTMTLHNAKVSIFDDSTPADKGVLKSKPVIDYLIQIEPINSSHPGWMIVRRYQDFETLHEVLRRISVISGITAFAEQHATLPNWKGQTKSSLRVELERYLKDALWHRQLAECEGMKRFLEKDQGLGRSSPGAGGKGFPAAFETMGKGMLDVLTNAPKGAADGGKAVIGGITGALGAVSTLGQKKPIAGISLGNQHRSSMSISSLARTGSMNSSSVSLSSAGGARSRDSQDLNGLARPSISQTPRTSFMGGQRAEVINEQEQTPPPSVTASSSSRSSMHGRNSKDVPSVDEQSNVPLSPPLEETEEQLNLPPPPSAINDDFNSTDNPLHILGAHSRSESSTVRTSTSTAPSSHSTPSRATTIASIPAESAPPKPSSATDSARRKALSEAETKVAVELLFAVINELYTLSSAWNIRRTLLTAAKTFLLRPGNPNLEAIRALLQDSVIEANTSDAGIAAHINKVRQNALPTENELKSWPDEMTADEKERLRVKARKLLVERGMPQALTSVMGAAASGEALGKVFDCLQVERVARGLMFGLLLQAVRAITQ